MYKQNLAGTVESYDRHVFLCYKNHQTWPPCVEASDDHPLPKSVATATSSSRSLKESNVDSFFNDVMVSCKPWDSGVQDVIAGSYIFVCAHGSRDCKVCCLWTVAEPGNLWSLGEKLIVNSHVI
ncbi:hypothetical protein MtrunA17_Chr6g0449421 [Medicago truncatula]|uniref:Sucrase/ferredoxin-like protein, putative n=1 Tax=Medicago truncatula TaxID=3880 RepID=A0A072U512_MEDTR|nr:sucrase/ferredoxin-like protein, putative [Medicago truncatula]RHN49702.1 hypothetical protein MtrunA17_Chr6g0449421 [Medicago truncatula]